MNKEQLKKLTIDELKSKLKDLHLRITGKKDVLIERITNYYENLNAVNQTNANGDGDSTGDDIEVERNDNDGHVRNDDGHDVINNNNERTITSTPVRSDKVNDNNNKYQFTPADMMSILPEFDPDDEKGPTAEEWYKRIIQLKYYYKWEDPLLLISIGPKLKGFARNWYNRMDEYCISWTDFAEQFERKFMPILNDADVHITMANRKRKYNENLMQYLEEMVRLGAKGRLKENAIVKYYIMGMRDDDLFQAFQGQRIERIDELRDKVQWCLSLRKTNNEKLKEFKPKIIHDNFRPNTKVDVKLVKNNKIHDVECFNCHKIGHYSRNCPDPPRRERCRKCNKVHKKGEPSECPGAVRVGVMECSKLPSMYHKIVKIENLKIVGQIDCGSPCTLIKEEHAKQLTGQKNDCEMYLSGFLGGTYIATKKMYLNIEIDKLQVDAEVFIVNNEHMPVSLLIGRNILDLPNIRMVKENSNVVLEHYINLDVDRDNDNDLSVDGKCINEDDKNFKILRNEKSELYIDQHFTANAIDIGDITNEEKHLLIDLLNDFKDSFPENLKGLGVTPEIEMKINVVDEKPVQLKAYRVPYAKRNVIDNMVKELIENNIVIPSKSNYSSPALLVKKKNGTDRLCIDYRMLNLKIVKEISATPNIEEELQIASSYKYFTTLDLNSGYYQIPISEESRKYTAFITPTGLFEFKRMPFGLKNAPPVFHQLMLKLKNKINDDIQIYMDDIMIGSNTVEENLHKLRKTMNALKDFNLTLNLNKCSFLKTTIEYLGHKISPTGISPGTLKTEAVKNFKVPNNIKEVRQFLGLTSYFRKFVKHFAIIANPLNQLLKKDSKFVWLPEHQEAFNNLKHYLINEPLLTSYNVNAKHEVHTDASASGLAGILLQQEGNVFKPVAYFSRTTSICESKYHSYELETLAIVETLERFKYYLLGKHFIVVTDCASLKSTMSKKELIPRIARWWLRLQEFDLSLEHRSGNRMVHVDALSRLPNESTSSEIDTASLKIMQVDIDDLDWLLTMQIQDPELKEIFTKLRETKVEKHIEKEYCIQNGRLFKILHNGNKRWIVPKMVRWRIVRECHDELGHLGLDKTVERLQKYYWFPRLRNYVSKYIKSCIECCYHRKPGGKLEGEFHYDEIEPIPFKTLHLDHLGPFPKSSKGNMHVFGISDAFSKFVIIRAVKATNTAGVIKVLDELFSYVGTPARIISDRGTAFTSKSFEDYCHEHAIQHVKVAVRTPRANGQIERVNRTVSTAIATLTKNERKWDEQLKNIQWSLNTMKSSTTGRSPHEIVFHFKPRDILQNKIILHIHDEMNENNNNSLEEIRNEAAENINRKRIIWKNRFDEKHRNPTIYDMDDLVMVECEPINTGQPRKLQPKYKGPYIISKILGNDRYVVEDIPGAPRKTRPYVGVYASDKMKKWCILEPDDDDEIDLVCNEENDISGTDQIEGDP